MAFQTWWKSTYPIWTHFKRKKNELIYKWILCLKYLVIYVILVWLRDREHWMFPWDIPLRLSEALKCWVNIVQPSSRWLRLITSQNQFGAFSINRSIYQSILLSTWTSDSIICVTSRMLLCSRFFFFSINLVWFLALNWAGKN